MQPKNSIDLKSEESIADFPRTHDIATVSVYGLAILSAGLFLFLPLINLVHPSPWQRSLGFIHGMGAMLTTIVIAYTRHLAFPLLRGSANPFLPRPNQQEPILNRLPQWFIG
jgi:MFS superfamily sulfate permease-like transporter